MGLFDFLKGKNKNIYNDNGLNEVYFKNGRGKIKERFFKKNGELDGLYETFGEYGNCILTKTNYKNGKKHGRYELHNYKISFDINKTDLDETYLFCVKNYYEGVQKDMETYSTEGWIRIKILENGNQFWYSSKDTLCTFEEVLNRISKTKFEVESNRIYKINDFVFEDIIKSNCTSPYSGIFEEKKYTDGKYCETVDSLEKEINNDKEREVLKHEIMTKGLFMFENSNGDYIEVFGQRHTLYLEYQSWSDEYNDWVENDREEVDCFYLTEYEDGYSFCEDELCKFFNIEKWPEWDYNGVSFDWCGIEEEDDNDERQKKWDNYKSKFPEVDTIDQFNIEN